MLILYILVILKFFKHKAKLLQNTKADGANGIVNIETIVAPLKYLNNFRRSLKMILINCKRELIPKWTKHYFSLQLVLIIMMLILIILFLLSKAQIYMSLLYLYQEKTIKNYQGFLAKHLKNQFIGMNIKQ